MNIIADPYLALTDLLRTKLLDQDGNPILKFVDLWYGQVDFPELHESFDYPALFIELSIQAADLAQSAQDATHSINLYIAQNSLADTFDQASQQAEAMQYLQLLTQIHALLHTATSPELGTLRFRSMARYGAVTNILTYVQTYTTNILAEGSTDIHHATEFATITFPTPPQNVNNAPPSNPFAHMFPDLNRE